MKGLGVAEQALIVNQFGDLVAYDPISLQHAHEQAQGDLEKERKPFQDLKDTGRAGDADGTDKFKDYEMEYAKYAGKMGVGGKTGRKGRRGRANSLRKGQKGKSFRK